MSLLWLVQKDLWAAAIILIPVVVPTTFVSLTIPYMMSLLMVGKTQQRSMAPNIKPQHFQTLRTLTSMTHHVLRVMLEHEAHKQ